jgi:hypothetical protein
VATSTGTVSAASSMRDRPPQHENRTTSSVQPLSLRKSANRRLLERLLDEEARPAACITNATMPVCRRSIPSSTVSSSMAWYSARWFSPSTTSSVFPPSRAPISWIEDPSVALRDRYQRGVRVLIERVLECREGDPNSGIPPTDDDDIRRDAIIDHIKAIDAKAGVDVRITSRRARRYKA